MHIYAFTINGQFNATTTRLHLPDWSLPLFPVPLHCGPSVFFRGPPSRAPYCRRPLPVVRCRWPSSICRIRLAGDAGLPSVDDQCRVSDFFAITPTPARPPQSPTSDANSVPIRTDLATSVAPLRAPPPTSLFRRHLITRTRPAVAV